MEFIRWNIDAVQESCIIKVSNLGENDVSVTMVTECQHVPTPCEFHNKTAWPCLSRDTCTLIMNLLKNNLVSGCPLWNVEICLFSRIEISLKTTLLILLKIFVLRCLLKELRFSFLLRYPLKISVFRFFILLKLLFLNFFHLRKFYNFTVL